MEERSSIFSLSIDTNTKSQLSEAAKWARFLAIVGFICLTLLAGAGVWAIINVNSLNAGYSRYGNSYSTGYTAGTVFSYFIVALIYFFPLLFLLRFSNHMRAAIAADNQERLNTSFQNLKICFRYLGILTIIGLVLVTLSLVLGVIARAGVN